MSNKCELCDNSTIDDEHKLCYKCYGWKNCSCCGYKFVEPDETYCSVACKNYTEGIINLKKPTLEDIIKSIKNDKTDYSYLFN